MTRQLDIDRVLDDWLAEGPSRLPDRVVTATVDRLDHIPQRRPWLPWSPTMNRIVTYAAGLAAVLVVAVAAWSAFGDDARFGGQPTPSTTPTPTESFTSTRHGYTIVLPAALWTFEQRPGTWELGAFFDPNTDSGVDYYERPFAAKPPALYAYIASQPVPGDMTFDEWVATHDTANEEAFPCFDLVDDFASATVGGEGARVGVHRCENWEADRAWANVQTLFIHDGRGYAFYLWPVLGGDLMPPVPDLKAESAAWLAGFTFTD